MISRNSVRIVSPIGGNVITTALLPLETDVTSVAYLPCEGKGKRHIQFIISVHHREVICP